MWKKVKELFTRAGINRPGAGKNILIVDDGEIERRVIRNALERRGYTVVVAKDGNEGLQMARDVCRKKIIDLAIVDFSMPGLNGKELCEQLKNEDATKDIPVIFLTGSATANDLVDCFDVGAEYYLTKPIATEHLIRQVEMILGELSK